MYPFQDAQCNGCDHLTHNVLPNTFSDSFSSTFSVLTITRLFSAYAYSTNYAYPTAYAYILLANHLLPIPSDLALPHYDTRDVSAITDLPYMVVSHDLDVPLP